MPEGGAPAAAVNSGLQSVLAQQQAGFMGGDPNALMNKLLFMFPSLNYQSVLDMQQLGLGKALWQSPSMAQFLNPSSPNGTLMRILKVLQVDQLAQGQMVMANMEQHQYEQAIHTGGSTPIVAMSGGESLSRPSTPDSGGGGGAMIG